MQHQTDLLPHLFRTEYSKIVAVLGGLFGFDHIETAEDIAGDTFLKASEVWSVKGLPENPVAWLYTVAKNKAMDHVRRNAVFNKKLVGVLQHQPLVTEETDIDLSDNNIRDSQLQMMFAICHPAIPAAAQVGLSLRILCGFGIEEIAAAFLTSRETINKRLTRAREKLREEHVQLVFPQEQEIDKRLYTVLVIIYLLFNEGYYSMAEDITLRRDLCFEAMRLALLLTDNPRTARPQVYALLALMCFHASRFDARVNEDGETILYQDQDTSLWNKELQLRGEHFLNLSATGSQPTKYHIEAAIAYWHTQKEDSLTKWQNILHLYNNLLVIEYSPIIALSRTYAIYKTAGKIAAIAEAEKLQQLTDNHLYHSVLGELYTDVDNAKAVQHLQRALALAKSAADRRGLERKLGGLK